MASKHRAYKEKDRHREKDNRDEESNVNPHNHNNKIIKPSNGLRIKCSLVMKDHQCVQSQKILDWMI